MIKLRVTQIFMVILMLALFCTMIVGIAWLFDKKPENLYTVWKYLGGATLIAFLIQLLFGAKIEFK